MKKSFLAYLVTLFCLSLTHAASSSGQDFILNDTLKDVSTLEQSAGLTERLIVTNLKQYSWWVSLKPYGDLAEVIVDGSSGTQLHFFIFPRDRSMRSPLIDEIILVFKRQFKKNHLSPELVVLNQKVPSLAIAAAPGVVEAATFDLKKLTRPQVQMIVNTTQKILNTYKEYGILGLQSL